ncbi:vWA domain-containing protein [Phycisphaera mikurensis]|uniref:vWA domain-containing protein n=1 Tax=Phycisphaera mikurensis TaxID=547188 RepID=UPI0014617071|nr:VWA domain-containing protein [Phycisphaera mikurensis]MBB6441706.1 hypothetical protein [Phycisphaera mikurensis]
MTLLSPFAALLAAALAVPALLALYFLKLRRRPLLVPSTLLWRKAVEDLEVNAPFQKLRNSLLLWLQLLLLALLIFAMAQPASDAPAPTGARVVILIDRSASMAVEEGGRTRLDAAKAAAIGVIDAMEAGASAMIIAFADEPEVVQPFAADRGRLRSAVASVRGSDRPGRPGRALALVGAQAGGVEGADAASVYVIGDSPAGGADAAATPPPAGASLRFLAIGADTPNLGFTAIGARRGLREPGRVELFARLENASPGPVEAGVTLDAGGERVTTRRVSVPGRGGDGAPGRRDLSLGFTASPSEAVAVTVAHDRADALHADDAARLVLPAAADRPVVLVTPAPGSGRPANPFLERAVRAASRGPVSLLSPEAWEASAPAPPADALLVFDRHAPSRIPPADALFFAAVPPLPGLGLRPSSPDAPAVQTFLTVDAADPAMRSVDPGGVPLVRPGRLVLPPGGEVLASGLEGPLIARVRDADAGRRFLVVAPDPLQGRWPLSVGFAVFLVNALDELGGGGGVPGEGLARRTGESAEVRLAPGATAEEVRYAGPAALAAPVRGGTAVLPAFERAGWYRAEDAGAVAPDDRRLGVSLAAATETDLRPPAALDAGPGTAARATPGGAATVRRSWIPWILAAALGVLLLEWFVYTGRFAPAPATPPPPRV